MMAIVRRVRLKVSTRVRVLSRKRQRTAIATLSFKAALVWCLLAIAAFHLAYCTPAPSFLILIYLIGLFQLTRVASGRQAFYFGLGVGLMTVAPQLTCFWTIFQASSIVLWLILAFWIGLFVALSRLCALRFGSTFGGLLAPFLWTGLEYFRSELYYLRFSWLNIGFVLPGTALLPFLKWLGVYGAGFAGMAIAVLMTRIRTKPALKRVAGAFAISIAALLALQRWTASKPAPIPIPERSIRVAGVQLEVPSGAEVIRALDKLIATEPEAKLLVLSEYTFQSQVPEHIKRWCHRHGRYLLAGGEDPGPNGNFYNTAYVVGPAGEVIFQQVKSVPIQFFRDGLPALEQKVWNSPWGKIGICICYDLSYSRITDQLIRLGAQALIVPTMDVAEWGQHQHELHSRVAPVRAAEYGVPIYRLASSGISQCVAASGETLAAAGYPGQGQVLTGKMVLASVGTLPPDRWLAPFSTCISAGVVVALAVWGARAARARSRARALRPKSSRSGFGTQTAEARI